MRLIDADILEKRIRETISDFAAEEDRECFRYALQIVSETPTADAIPIKWMQKTVVEMIFDGEHITEEDRTILNGLIARWEKENGRAERNLRD